MSATEDYFLKAQKYYTRVHKHTQQFQYVNFIFLIQCMGNQQNFKDCYKFAYDFMMQQKYPQQRFHVSMFSNAYKNLIGWTSKKDQLTTNFNTTITSYDSNTSGHAASFQTLQTFMEGSNEVKGCLNIIFIITNNNGATFWNANASLKAINDKPNNKLFVLDCAQETYSNGHTLSRTQPRNSWKGQNLYPQILFYELSNIKEIGQFFKILILKKEEFERRQNLVYEIELYEKKLKSLDDNYQKQKIQYTNLNQKFIQSENLIKKLNTKIQNLQQSSSNLLKDKIKLELKNQNLKNEIQKINKEKQQIIQDKSILYNKEIELLNKQLKKSTESQKNYKIKVEELQNEILQLKEKLSKALIKQQSLEKQIIKQSDEKLKMFNENKKLTDHIAELQFQLKQKNNEINELNQNLNTTNLEKQMKNQEILKLNQIIKEKKETLHTISNSFDARDQQISRKYNQKLEQIQTQYKQKYQMERVQFEKDRESVKNRYQQWKVEQIEKIKQLKTQAQLQIDEIKKKSEEIHVNIVKMIIFARSVKIQLQCKISGFESYHIKIYQINGPIQNKNNREYTYNSNQIVIKNLIPQTQYRFEILVKLKQKIELNWQQSPQFYFKTKQQSDIHNVFDIQSEEQKKNIIQKKIQEIKKRFTFEINLPQFQFKISLFGQMGQGKSTTLNTIASTIKGEYVYESLSGNSNESITLQMSKKRNILDTTVPIAIYDVFGIEPRQVYQKQKSSNPLQSTNYNQCFHYFFDGSLYEGYKVNQTIDKEKLIKFQDGIDRLSHQIHGVIYVLSYHSLNDKEVIEQTKHIIKLLRLKGIKPVIALTKCDQLIENAPISELTSHKNCISKIKEFTEKLSEVESHDIFLIANYVTRETRDYNKEYLILNMLDQVLIRSKQRLYRKLENFFWLQKQENKNFYGAVQQISLQNYGSKIEPILKKSFKNLGLDLDKLMFLSYQYVLGVKTQNWVKIDDFLKAQLKNFVKQIQNKKIIKIKVLNNDLGEISRWNLPIYDPIKKKRLGAINFGNLTIQESKRFYELTTEEDFSIIKDEKVVSQQDYINTKLSQIIQQNFIEAKIHTQIATQIKKSIEYLVSFIDPKAAQDQKLIDQCYIPKKSGMKNKDFYNLIRKQLPDILQNYTLYKLQTARPLLESDELLQKQVIIKDDTITVNIKKK